MKKNTDLHLRADEPVSAGIRRFCDTLLQDAIRHIEHPSRDREEDIHAVRTDIKQVRAILRLIQPVIGDRIFRRENRRLRKTAQLLAPMRDAAIGLQTIRRLAKKTEGAQKRSDLSTVETHFARRLESVRVASQEKVMCAAVRALEADRQHLHRLRFAADDWSAIEPGLEKVYRACRRRMRRAFAQGEDDSFHRWRIRVKNLYYELQFLLPVWPERLGPMVARLKKVQEQIGDDHDLTVLKAALQKAPHHFGGALTIKSVLRQLKKRSRKLRRTCRPVAEKLLQEKPRRFVLRFQRHLEIWWKGASASHPLHREGLAIVLVTHNTALAAGARLLEMRDGAVRER